MIPSPEILLMLHRVRLQGYQRSLETSVLHKRTYSGFQLRVVTTHK